MTKLDLCQNIAIILLIFALGVHMWGEGGRR